MDTKSLLAVARRIESMESQLVALKNQARKIVAGQAAAAPIKAKRRKMSAAARKRISDAMKKRWAGIKR
jgi:hypothetical protein